MRVDSASADAALRVFEGSFIGTGGQATCSFQILQDEQNPKNGIPPGVFGSFDPLRDHRKGGLPFTGGRLRIHIFTDLRRDRIGRLNRPLLESATDPFKPKSMPRTTRRTLPRPAGRTAASPAGSLGPARSSASASSTASSGSTPRYDVMAGWQSHLTEAAELLERMRRSACEWRPPPLWVRG